MRLPFFKTIVLPAFTAVGSGQTATCKFPMGDTYHWTMLAYSGLTLAQINGLRVKGDGRGIQNYPNGLTLNKFNMFHGRANGNAGVIFVDFTRFGLTNPNARDMTAIGTGLSSKDTGNRELSTLTMEVDIDGAAASPALNARAYVSPARTLGMVRHIRDFTQSPSGAGLHQISDFPKGHAYNGVHFDSDKIDNLIIERDRYNVFDRDKAENSAIQVDGVRVPTADEFVFDPTEFGDGELTLQTAGVHDLRFKLDMSDADVIPIITDTIAPLF